MGFRVMNAGKSKYYSNALANFESTRDLYRKADGIRVNHSLQQK